MVRVFAGALVGKVFAHPRLKFLGDICVHFFQFTKGRPVGTGEQSRTIAEAALFEDFFNCNAKLKRYIFHIVFLVRRGSSFRHLKSNISSHISKGQSEKSSLFLNHSVTGAI